MKTRTGGTRTLGGLLMLVLIALTAGALWWVMKSASTPGATPNQAQGAPSSAGKLDAVLNAAESHRRQGEFVKAETILKAAAAEHPLEQSVHALHAEVLLGMDRATDAHDAYVRALSCGERTPVLEFAAGTAASMAGRPERAVEHYSAAQAGNPSDWQAPLFLAQVHIKLNDIAEAKKNLLLSAKLKPDVAVTWGTLADLALRENATSLALQHVAKAREIDPGETLWRLIEARALKRDHRPEEALQRLVGLRPQERLYPGVIPLMSECYGLLNKPADAASLYAWALEQEPADAEYALQAALWFERAGDRARALECARRAEMLGSEDGKKARERLEKP